MFYLLRKFFRPKRNYACFGRTDTGKVREHNEDNFSILADRDIYLVADGMGGHNAGEVASRIAIETLVNHFPLPKVRSMSGNREEIRHSLITGFHSANKTVMDMASDDAALQGMGSTLVACHIDDGIMHTCHVGDSRCYLDNGQELLQITTDHSSAVTVSTGKNNDQSPGRHVLTSAVGFPFPKDPEYHDTAIQPGNKILLCSDGLWSMVDDQQIQQILQKSASPEEASDTLVQLANEAGGKDNITALVIFC